MTHYMVKVDNHLYEEAIEKVYNLPRLRWEDWFENKKKGDVE